MAQLLYQNGDGDVLTEEELKCRFREHFDGAHPEYKLGVIEGGLRYVYTFSPARIVEELDAPLFRGQFLAYQDEYGWDELGSDETEVTLESWRQARNDARTP